MAIGGRWTNGRLVPQPPIRRPRHPGQHDALAAHCARARPAYKTEVGRKASARAQRPRARPTGSGEDARRSIAVRPSGATLARAQEAAGNVVVLARFRVVHTARTGPPPLAFAPARGRGQRLAALLGRDRVGPRRSSSPKGPRTAVPRPRRPTPSCGLARPGQRGRRAGARRQSSRTGPRRLGLFPRVRRGGRGAAATSGGQRRLAGYRPRCAGVGHPLPVAFGSWPERLAEVESRTPSAAPSGPSCRTTHDGAALRRWWARSRAAGLAAAFRDALRGRLPSMESVAGEQPSAGPGSGRDPPSGLGAFTGRSCSSTCALQHRSASAGRGASSGAGPRGGPAQRGGRAPRPNPTPVGRRRRAQPRQARAPLSCRNAGARASSRPAPRRRSARQLLQELLGALDATAESACLRWGSP
jgi:hypothetical protein